MVLCCNSSLLVSEAGRGGRSEELILWWLMVRKQTWRRACALEGSTLNQKGQKDIDLHTYDSIPNIPKFQ
jgi:hypothetical protein